MTLELGASVLASLLALGVAGYNAWTRSQMRIALLELEAKIADKYVSHEAFEKELLKLETLTGKLAEQVVALQRLIDRQGRASIRRSLETSPGEDRG